MTVLELDTYTVRVTSERIVQAAPVGMPRSLCCPVASALTADTGGLWASGRRDAWRRDIKLSDARNVISWPAWVVDKIGDFDIWGEMEPFQFVLVWGGTRWNVEKEAVRRQEAVTFLTASAAAEWLRRESGVPGDFSDPDVLARAFRAAALKLHSDTGGDHYSFLTLKAAMDTFKKGECK